MGKNRLSHSTHTGQEYVQDPQMKMMHIQNMQHQQYLQEEYQVQINRENGRSKTFAARNESGYETTVNP